MKTFTYVAAIALLTAGTAFAQAQSGAAAGANGSTINNSTPTPAAKGAAEGAPRTSTGTSGTMMNQSGSSSMGSGSSSMNQSSDMDHAGSKSKHASTKSKARHIASARSGGNDSKENQETMQLNRQQVAGMPAGMNSSGMNSSGMGASGSGARNPFNNGSPQQAQGGGANCTPDNPSCGTARQNPAIQSSPQHRTYGDQQQ